MKKKSNTGRLLLLVITLLLVAIVIVISVSISQSQDINDTAGRVSQTEKILLHTEKLIKAVLDNETGVRGYIITGQKTFQEPLIKSKKELFTELGHLKILTDGNPIQQTRVDSLYYYINKRQAFSEQILLAFEEKGPARAQAIVASGLGKLYTDNIRVLIDKIQATENILLDQRRWMNEKKLSVLNKVLVSVIICIITLLAFFIWKVWLDFIEKKVAADSLAKLNQELEQKVFDRTSELLKSKNSIEEILLRIEDGFISLDENWCYTYINKAAGELIQQNPESLIGKNVWEVFPDIVDTEIYNIFHKVMTEKQYQWNQDYYQPLDSWQENHVYPSAGGISVFIRNITETKRKEKELEQNNQRFQYVTKATSDAIWDWNIIDDTMYWGAGIENIFGYLPEEIMTDNCFWTNHVHPEDIGRVLKKQRAVMAGSGENWMDEYRFLKADDNYAFTVDRGFVIRDGNGKAIRMVGAMQDISKKKEEENRLKLLESVITNSNDAIIITETEKAGYPVPRISYVNRAYTNMTGYTAEEVIGRPSRFLEGPKTDPAVLKLLDDSILRKEGCEVTAIGYKKNGEAFWINIFLIPIKDAEGSVRNWISIERDVTEKKNDELQKKLMAEISQVFLETAQLNQKLEKVLEKIVQFGSFSMAESWLVDAEKKQINLAACFATTANAQLFYGESGGIKNFLKGQGLPGITWKSVTSQCWNNVGQQQDFVRKEAAKKVGLHCVYAFPILCKYEVIGVLVLGLNKDEQWPGSFNQLFENVCLLLGAEIKRKQLEQELDQVFSFAPDIICIINKEGFFTKINPAASELLGYSQQELLSVPFLQFVHPDDRANTLKVNHELLTGNTTLQFDNRFVTKTEKIKWLCWSSTPSPEGHVFAVAKDITEKKSLEEKLDKTNNLARIGSWEVDMIKNTVYFSKITKEIFGVSDDFIPTKETGINFYKEGINRERITAVLTDAIKTGTAWDMELQIITAEGNERWIRGIGQAEMLNGKCVLLFGTFQDIDVRKKAELSFINVLEEKANILESIGDAFFTLDKNWVVTYWNKRAEEMQNKPRVEIIGKNIWEVFPSVKNRPAWKYFHLAASANTIQHFENFTEATGTWYEVSAYPSSNGLSVYFKDITERKWSEKLLIELNENLQKQTNELAISNKELEQYAYVASHDLQEPLRMVTSFLTKIDLKYRPVLDEKGKSYIDFAVNGAKRMRQIILDLLDFSLVGRKESEWEEVDLNGLLIEIIDHQNKIISEKKAIINTGHLPVLIIPLTPVRQVFQNLIHNGLKYQKQNAVPQITIGSKELTSLWQFSVADNGIGIDAAYFNKIFVIFQRLHNMNEYSGTGIGLAVTKKIIDNIGGTIWVESELGKGSTFYFTIPKYKN